MSVPCGLWVVGAITRLHRQGHAHSVEAWLDGEFLDATELGPDRDGVLETLLVRDGRAPLWDRHMRRLRRSVAELSIDWTEPSGLRDVVLELARRNPAAYCIGLHPGTVDTALSEPFQRAVPNGKLLTPDQAARHLLAVLDNLRPGNSGSIFAWDGNRVEY